MRILIPLVLLHALCALPVAVPRETLLAFLAPAVSRPAAEVAYHCTLAATVLADLFLLTTVTSVARTAVVAAAGGAAACTLRWALGSLDSAAAYYVYLVLVLFCVICVVVLVAAGVSSLILWFLGRLMSRRRFRSSYSLLVAWRFLRSERSRLALRSRLARSWKEWVPPARTGAVERLALLAPIGVAAGAALFALNIRADSVRGGVLFWAGLALVGCGLLLSTRLAFGLLRAGGRLPRALRPETDTRLLHVPGDGVTVQSFISIVGVAIGVWALILVLSVMSGFENDLRSKILGTNAHLLLRPAEESSVLSDGIALSDRLSTVSGVERSWPMVEGNVMLSSPTNLSVNLVLRGMDPRTIDELGLLSGKMVLGDISFLSHPERLVSDRGFAQAAARLKPAAPLPEVPDVAPTTQEGEPPGEPAASPSIEDDTGLPEPERAGPDTHVYPGILIGSELASALSATVGSEIQVISPEGEVGPTGLVPRSRSFRVAGIFKTGMYEFDLKLAFAAMSEVQRFLDTGAGVNRVEARLSDPGSSDALLAAVGSMAGPDIRALDWKEMNRNLFSALKLERIVMFVVLGFVVLVASFSIVGSLVLIIVEKSREIAILKAMGATDRGVMRSFLLLGLLIGVVGTASGLLLALGSCLGIKAAGIPLPHQYYIDRIPVALSAPEVAAVVAAALIVALGATAWPSLRASRLRAVEGLRYE